MYNKGDIKMNNYEKAKEEGINNWEQGLAEVSDDGGFEYTLSFLSSFAEKIKDGVEKDIAGKYVLKQRESNMADRESEGYIVMDSFLSQEDIKK